MVFRITRGHAYLQIQDFDDDVLLFQTLEKSIRSTITFTHHQLEANQALYQHGYNAV